MKRLRRLHRIAWIGLFYLICLAMPASAETPFSLCRAGYEIIYEGYEEWEGCDYDEPRAIGPYIIICDSYSYSYYYGEVILFASVFTYEGQQHVSAYLCQGETDDDCDDVNIVHKR